MVERREECDGFVDVGVVVVVVRDEDGEEVI